MNKKVRKRKIKYFYKLALTEEQISGIKASDIYDPRIRRVVKELGPGELKFIPNPEMGDMSKFDPSRYITSSKYEEFLINNKKYRLYNLEKGGFLNLLSTNNSYPTSFNQYNYRYFGENCFNFTTGRRLGRDGYEKVYHDKDTKNCIFKKFKKMQEEYFKNNNITLSDTNIPDNVSNNDMHHVFYRNVNDANQIINSEINLAPDKSAELYSNLNKLCKEEVDKFTEINTTGEVKNYCGDGGPVYYVPLYNLGKGFYLLESENTESFYGDADYVVFYNNGALPKKLDNFNENYILNDNNCGAIAIFSKNQIKDKNPAILDFSNTILEKKDYNPEDAAKIKYRVPRPKFSRPPECEDPTFFNNPLYSVLCDVPDGGWNPPNTIPFPTETGRPTKGKELYDRGELDDPRRKRKDPGKIDFCARFPNHPNCPKNLDSLETYRETDDLPIRDTKTTDPFKTPYDPKKYRK